MTIRKQLRTLATASLLALAVVASPALQGDALAAGKKENNAPSIGAPTTTERAAPGSITQQPPAVTQPTKPKGPPEKDNCDRWTDQIVSIYEAKMHAYRQQDYEMRDKLLDLQYKAQAAAEAEGCIVIVDQV